MNRFHRAVGFFMLFVSTSGLYAGPPPPLVLEVVGQKPVIVPDYQVKTAADPLQLNVHIGAEAARSLQTLTQKNVGRQLLFKQGDRVIFSPTIKAALASQDFMISFKTAKERDEFIATR